jgi:hypothetical protein
MLGISLYSYPYLNSQNSFVFLIIAYVFSSTKLEIKAEQILLVSKGVCVWGRRKWWGMGGEVVQTMYAHTNK